MADAAYQYGVFDILRAKDLNELDRNIQLSKERGNELFAVGVYSADLCNILGISEPLKSLEDRMKIMEQITGVDFVFPVYALDENVISKYLKEAYKLYCQNREKQPDKKKKNYEIGYAPGTYDLFHAGHLENLTIAASHCEKLIVGVKSDELVMEHKHKTPIISDEERMEILRHFKFVYDVYKYHTRDPRMADKWIRAKYGKGIGSVFMGSDLKDDFKDVKGIKITYTPRSKEKMKTTSTTAYRTVKLGRDKKKTTYTGNAEEGRKLREKAAKERVNTIQLNDTDRTD